MTQAETHQTNRWIALRQLLLPVLASCLFVACGSVCFRPLDSSFSGYSPSETWSNAAATAIHQIAYIEFDEQGDFFDRRQLSNAASNMFASLAHTNRLVVMYVHGWNNNARSADAIQFNLFLNQLARFDTIKKGGFKVFGIYLAWQGSGASPGQWLQSERTDPALRLIMAHDKVREPHTTNRVYEPEPPPQRPFFDPPLWVPRVLSLPFREASADGVAGEPLAECIYSLSNFARTMEDTNHAARVVLIGHSFGARVIERTILATIANQGMSTNVTLPADLVILLNSAAPAIYAKRIIDFFKWRTDCIKESNKPWIVSIRSESDVLTDHGTHLYWGLFGLPKKLGGAFQSNKREDSLGGFPKEYFFTRTAAFTRCLETHDAQMLTNVCGDNPTRGVFFAKNIDPGAYFIDEASKLRVKDITNNWFVAYKFHPGALTGPKCPYAAWRLDEIQPEGIQAIDDRYNRTPYWIVRVPNIIIKDHGDILNANSCSLMAALVRMSGRLDVGMLKDPKPRTMTVLPPTNTNCQGTPQLFRLPPYREGPGQIAAALPADEPHSRARPRMRR